MHHAHPTDSALMDSCSITLVRPRVAPHILHDLVKWCSPSMVLCFGFSGSKLALAVATVKGFPVCVYQGLSVLDGSLKCTLYFSKLLEAESYTGQL